MYAPIQFICVKNILFAGAGGGQRNILGEVSSYSSIHINNILNLDTGKFMSCALLQMFTMPAKAKTSF